VNYYNENDQKCCARIKELINAGLVPDGEIDQRSIHEVRPDDLTSFVQCHFFAGILGWPLALRLAGWPESRPVVTVSCPCQPFSCAGKGKGIEDERHLWPEAMRLISALAPEVVFGEQVASAEVVGTELEAAFVDAVQRGDHAAANRAANKLVKSHSIGYSRRWLDGIQADLEESGYTLGAVVLGAHSVGAPHKRQRLYWMANAKSQLDRRGVERQGRRIESSNSGTTDSVGHPDNPRRDAGQSASEAAGYRGSTEPTGGHAVALGDCQQPRLEGHGRDVDDGDKPGREPARAVGPASEAGAVVPVGQPDRSGRQSGQPAASPAGHGSPTQPAGFWSDFQIIQTRDGKFRRIPDAQSLFQRMANVAPDYLDAMRDSGASEAEITEIWQACGGYPVARNIPGRIMLLKGSGNCIVPELAAEFIKAAMNL